MVPHHRFGSRSAIRPRNLPSSSSRLRRGYDRAPRGAVSYCDYLSRLRSVPVTEVLTRRGGDPYPKGAAEAIVLSLRAVQDADESGLTTRVVAAIAVVAPTGVDRGVLREILRVGGGDAGGPVVRAWHSALRVISARTLGPTPTTTVPASVDEALARLVGLSLLG